MKLLNLIFSATFFFVLASCNSNDKYESTLTSEKENLYKGELGSCCKDLKDALDTSVVANSHFKIDKNNLLYLTTGYFDTGDGHGYINQAVIYCPFCGEKLQDKNEIKMKATH